MDRKSHTRLQPQSPLLRGQTVLVPYPNPKTRQEEIAWTIATTIEDTGIWNADSGCTLWTVRYESTGNTAQIPADCIMGYLIDWLDKE